MIAFLHRATRQRRLNRARRRALEGQRAGGTAVLDWVEAMAAQLAEIRALPEAPDPCR
jgi:hypothetical protein